MRVEIKKGKKGYHWRIIASNGKILAHSEDYSSLSKCKNTFNQICVWMYSHPDKACL